MRLFPAATLATVALATLATPAAAQSLDETMAAAIGHSPELAAARARERAAQGRVNGARAEHMPSLTAQGEVGVGRLDPKGYFGLTADDVTPRAASATVELPLLTFGRIGSGLNQAKAGREAARLGVRAALLKLRIDVVSAYSDALKADEQLASYGKLAQTLDEQVRHAKLRFKVGGGTSVEVAQAEARAAEAQAGLAMARGAKAGAVTRLRALTGKDITPVDEFPGLPVVPISADQASEQALRANPQLQQAEAMVKAAKAGVSGARAERFPTVGAYAEASTVRDKFFPGYKADEASVGLRARWTLFDGGRTSARVTTAEAQLDEAQANADAARYAVEQQAVQGFSGLETARAMLKAAQARVRATEEALRGTRLEVQTGAKPQLALLDAEREAIAARTARIEAQGQVLTAAYTLRAITGAEDQAAWSNANLND
ncbi:TolC family protein [Novosphingobium sp. ZN18A2]|uniref:TolC family protein n=1 Tax=Novosphingobium sp. ZN18A2 TaxID=3079861 RepID=UPI0030CD7183